MQKIMPSNELQVICMHGAVMGCFFLQGINTHTHITCTYMMVLLLLCNHHNNIIIIFVLVCLDYSHPLYRTSAN